MIPVVYPSQPIRIDSLVTHVPVSQGNLPVPGYTRHVACKMVDRRRSRRRLPRWMAPTRGSLFGLGRHQPGTAMSLPLAGVGEQVTATAAHGGLLVRGGGEAVIPMVALGAILFATACLSAVVERRTKAGAVVGAPLLSFGTFCALSNLGMVPSAHPIYDLCWSRLLPLSLSVIVLGNPIVAQNCEQHSNSDQHEQLSAAECSSGGSIAPMGRVGLSFLIGALGSVLGVVAAYHVATISGAGVYALPRDTAAQMAGALTATYIGGSVNLFAVAAAVGLSMGGSSLLGALAASDIFLMALYFSGLMAAHKTPLLRRAFPGREATLNVNETEIEAPLQDENSTGIGTIKADSTTTSPRSQLTTTLFLVTVGSTVCAVGNAVAERSPLPGTATMAVTLLTVGAARALAGIAPNFQSSLSRTGSLLATVLLNAFFGSIGASGRWTQVVGVAPAVFTFAAMALGVHIAVITAGAAVLNRCCGVGLGIDDIIVASNANIGGPSTAATFAGLIGQDELVVPAAVWGTVGYAIATTLGVGVWAALR